MSGSHLFAIIDDDVAIREALQDLLRSCGYRALSFGSAEDFLERADPETVSCIILDMRMPGMNGLELQNVLKGAGSRTPIIFMTSQSDDATRVAAISAGAHDFLAKPVDDEVLLDSIRAALTI
jgi:FixJ family two-component response regulator